MTNIQITAHWNGSDFAYEFTNDAGEKMEGSAAKCTTGNLTGSWNHQRLTLADWDAQSVAEASGTERSFPSDAEITELDAALNAFTA